LQASDVHSDLYVDPTAAAAEIDVGEHEFAQGAGADVDTDGVFASSLQRVLQLTWGGPRTAEFSGKIEDAPSFLAAKVSAVDIFATDTQAPPEVTRTTYGGSDIEWGFVRTLVCALCHLPSALCPLPSALCSTL
jgi:hypothetical protein